MAKNGFTGAIGEFYVAAYLSAHDLLVALPRAGIPGSDMFVGAVQGPPLRIQVKTGTRSTKKDKVEGPIYLWSTTLSVIEKHDKSLWYAFVWLNGWPKEEGKLPEVFIVPSFAVVERMKLVRAEIEQSPKTWPYFWLRVDEADQYKGKKGVDALTAAAKLNMPLM